MTRMRPTTLAIATALVLAFAGAQPARAAISFELGNNPEPNEEQNILFGAKEQGSTITGFTNSSPAIGVTFTSSTDTLIQNAKGQASISALDGAINQVSIEADTLFNDLILNLRNGEGEALVQVFTASSTSPFSYTLGNGQNFLTIISDSGNDITLVTVTATGGFDVLAQTRISFADVNPVPEPASLATAGLGLLMGLGYAWRRRKQAAA